MKSRLFSIQDSTQMIRALAIIYSSGNVFDDYIIIHTTKLKKYSRNFLSQLICCLIFINGQEN